MYIFKATFQAIAWILKCLSHECLWEEIGEHGRVWIIASYLIGIGRHPVSRVRLLKNSFAHLQHPFFSIVVWGIFYLQDKYTVFHELKLERSKILSNHLHLQILHLVKYFVGIIYDFNYQELSLWYAHLFNFYKYCALINTWNFPLIMYQWRFLKNVKWHCRSFCFLKKKTK